MTYTQTDIDDGIVMKIGDKYYLTTDIQFVLDKRIKSVNVTV
jgi:hypothetical protein